MSTATATSNAVDFNTAPYGVLLLRVSLGVMWIAHAALKYFVFTPAGTAQFFASVGFPSWLAGPTIAIEFLGGVAILLGVYSRQVSLLLVPVMLGAASVHFGNGWVFSAPNGGWEYPIFLTIASIVYGLLGDGKYALKSKGKLV